MSTIPHPHFYDIWKHTHILPNTLKRGRGVPVHGGSGFAAIGWRRQGKWTAESYSVQLSHSFVSSLLSAIVTSYSSRQILTLKAHLSGECILHIVSKFLRPNVPLMEQILLQREKHSPLVCIGWRRSAGRQLWRERFSPAVPQCNVESKMKF